jgi:4-hydroxybenzoate polyprenyltransferase
MKLRAYLELIRLPNVFTALADVAAGYWLLSRDFAFTATLGWAALASAALYSAGIVLNDLCDIGTDRRERPTRPLPSSRISVPEAWRLCGALFIVAFAGTTLAGSAASMSWRHPLAISTALLAFIALYDCQLKKTPLGPACMGMCRALNLLLGASAAMTHGGKPTLELALVAASLFFYVTSFSFFGRDEASISSRRRLTIGGAGVLAAVMTLGIATGLRLTEDPIAMVLWLALIVHVARVTARAIKWADALSVQYAMRTLILAIIPFDAVIATAAHGWQSGVCVLLLLLPAIFLGRWIYST